MDFPIKRAMHFDFHTMPGIYDFNREWDAAVFADMLKKSNITYINLVAQCNIGFSYYPTKKGVPYPGMKGDMFGDALNECHKRGIGVTGYISAGLSHEQALRHTEWLRVDKEGHIIHGDRTANFFRTMCFNTGYKDYLLDVIREVCAYPIDGLFLDSMAPMPCYCPHCTNDMLSLGIDLSDDDAVTSFSYQKILEFADEVKKIAGADRYLVFNGIPYYDVKDIIKHIEIECLPAGIWGYDTFAKTAAYARNIKKDVVYMTGRFQRCWGDFGGYRTIEAIENDMFDAVQNGFNISVGDHLHPAGLPEKDILNDIGGIYAKMAEYEKWTKGTAYTPEIGVLVTLGAPDADSALLGDSLSGLARMMGELKYQFDILDARDLTQDYTRFKCIILADDFKMSAEVLKKLRAYTDNGGKVLSTGLAGLNEAETDFALAGQDFEYGGKDTSNSSYFIFRKVPKGSADMRYSVYSEGIIMKARREEYVFADHVKPYFDRKWDGRHGYFYTPPEKKTGTHAAAVSGNAAHISFRIFKAYYLYAMREHKRLVAQILERFIPKKRIYTEKLGSYARVTVTENEKYSLVHCKVTYPEVRGKAGIIEEHAVQPQGSVAGLYGQYRSVSVVPEEKRLTPVYEEGYTKVILPEFKGYLMLRFEK